MNRLKDAQQIMDKIGEKPNKKLIRYKLHIYTLLGEAYYKQGYYALSMIKYEKAIQYYNVFKIKEFDYIFQSYVKSCISLADWCVDQDKIDEAFMALEKAYKIDPENVIINYKLGLLNIDNDPYKAYDYLHFDNPAYIHIKFLDACLLHNFLDTFAQIHYFFQLKYLLNMTQMQNPH